VNIATSKSVSATHASIEPCDEGSNFRILPRSKKPEPIEGMFIKTEKKASNRNTNQMLLFAARSPYPEA
jgi:hypothetical protein